MTFPKAQFEAIKREREADVAVEVKDLRGKIADLIAEEEGLNAAFWNEVAASPFRFTGLLTDAANGLMHERNAVRVRLRRFQEKLMRCL